MAESVQKIGLDMADTALIRSGNGNHYVTGTTCNSHAAEAHVDEVLNLKCLGAGAQVSESNAYAGHSVSPVKASAFAGANVREASANAYLIEGIEVGARATLCEANTSATADLTGAHAAAAARVARAQAGMKNTPLQAHAELVGAGAETGVSFQYTGASAGAHLGEAKAGPFAVRAGVKVGAGVRNGVPEVDLGPITLPCCVM